MTSKPFPRDPFARTHRRTRSGLRNWTSAIALATVLAMPVREGIAGNAYAGSAPGSADYSIFNSGTNSETITINTPTAVIDWTPQDTNSGTTAIDFLPANKTVTYENDVENLGGYTVLNRILPGGDAAGRGIALNGTIVSNLLDENGEVIGPGGNIWFYSPGGLLIGNTARFDVGSLVLSTVPIGFQNSSATTGLVSTGSATAGSSVRIDESDSGRGVFADNYVGVLAPRIEQAGSVNAGGSVAYIAAEAANLSFNNGLFDITVSTGSIIANAIIHDGATRVTADGAGTKTGIYLVAVPKNVAMTMLLTGGDLDFTLAGGAIATDQGVVLSAGRDVLDGAGSTVGGGLRPVSAGTTGGQPVAITGGDIAVASDAPIHVRTALDMMISGGDYGGPTDIFTGGTTLTIDTSAGATIFDSTTMIDSSRIGADSPNGGGVYLAANGGSTLTFTGALGINAGGTGQSSSGASGGDISAVADGASSIINFNGGLTANADGTGAGDAMSSAAGGTGTGGTVYIGAQNAGRVNIVGGATLTGIGIGGNSMGSAGAGQGGSVGIDANGGTIVSSGVLSLQAFAKGGDGGDGGGATARIFGNMSSASAVFFQARGGGSITQTGNLQLTANALGGLGAASGSSGTASAGEILISGDGGQVTVTGAVTATANATLATSVAGGDATGGVLRIFGAGSTSHGVIMGDFTGSATATAGSSLGSSEPAGSAQGGMFNLTANGGALIDGEALSAMLTGTGGSHDDGSGGSGNGGTATLFTNGSSAHVDFAETIDLNVGGFGGNGSSGGGLGNGGTVNAGILSDGGAMTLHGLTALGDGTGGGGGTGAGGDGTGGFLRLVADAGTITSSGSIILRADSEGGSGATGGSAIAVTGMTPRGFVALGGAGGSLNHSGSVLLDAKANAGGSFGTGAAGTALGGSARLFNSGSGTVTITGSVGASVDANIADGEGDGGGNATGGFLEISGLGSGNLTLQQDYTGTARGFAGRVESASSASAGLGRGGSFTIQSNGSNILSLSGFVAGNVSGYGGSSQGGAGGEGRGGTANLFTGDSGGTILSNTIEFDANGFGGNGSSGGGLGLGGVAVVATNATGGSIEGDDFFLSAQGYGGDAFGTSSTGGIGRGGLAGFRAYQGSIEIQYTGVADASGLGGDGQIGGDGFGGTPPGLGEGDFDPYFAAFANSFSGDLTVLGSGEGGGLYLYSTGTGGSGGPNASGINGASGNGFGGYVESVALLDDSGNPGESSIDLNFLVADATGSGGEGNDATAMGLIGGGGGNGTGGRILVAGTAGKGSLNIAEAELYAFGFGGEGGAGNGFDGALGVGGNGGSGSGGSIQFGMISGLSTMSTNGQATFGGVVALAAGVGGAGGDGADGDDSINGGNGTDGGNGGIGEGGSVLLSGFGAPVVTGSVNLNAIGQAGIAGEGGAATGSSGTTAGDDGLAGLSATGGDVNVLVAARSGQPTQLGSLQIAALFGDATAINGAGSNLAGTFLIRTSGGSLTVDGTTTMLAGGTGAPSIASEVSAQNGTVTFTGAFTGSTVGPVNFFLDADGAILRPGGCTVNSITCTPGPRNSPPPPPPPPPVSPPPPPPPPVVSPPPPPPPPPVVSPPPPPPPPVESPPPPPPPVESPPPPPPPPVESPPPPPPPVVSPPPPPPPPPPVESPPPPPVVPPPPPPPIEVPEVVSVVETETTNITSSIQASLTGTRVAGGSVNSTPPPAASPPPPPAAASESSESGGSSDSGSSSESESSASSSESSDSASADEGGSEEATADEGGDEEETSEEAASESGGAVGNPNVLVDTSTIGSTTQEIEVPVTSSGNSSLWQGADGLGDLPGGESR